MTISKELKRCLRRLPATQSLLANWEDRRYIQSLNREAHELQWQLGPRAPQKRVEAGRLQLGEELFLFGGYISLGVVSNRVDVLNLRLGKWTRQTKMPSTAAQTHNGVTTDEIGTIFSISGQLGPNCAPVTPDCFALDATTLKWRELPALPQGRYMPLVHFRQGRIHCLGGSMPDRISPSTDHWSLGIHAGQPTESTWREEASLPSGRTHTASHLMGDKLYVLGGQKGDIPAIPAAPDFACNFDTPFDEVLDEVFCFDLGTGVSSQLALMPKKISHSEHAVVQVGSKIIVAGGVIDRMTMDDSIFAYDTQADRWETVGRLPYPMKSKTAAHWKGWLYIIAGQKSVSQVDLRPAEVLSTVWRARLPDAMEG